MGIKNYGIDWVIKLLEIGDLKIEGNSWIFARKRRKPNGIIIVWNLKKISGRKLNVIGKYEKILRNLRITDKYVEIKRWRVIIVSWKFRVIKWRF